jgi:hypothetical protein
MDKFVAHRRMDELDELELQELLHKRKTRSCPKPLLVLVLLSIVFSPLFLLFGSFSVPDAYVSSWQNLDKVPFDAAEIIDKCNALHVLPAPPSDFYQRSHSDRFQDGTPPTLLRNASIWTGRVSGNEVVEGDLLIDKGLIIAIGFIDDTTLAKYKDLVVIETEGAWITPGYVVPNLSLFSSLIKPLLASLTFTLIWALTALPVLRGLTIQIQ